MALPWLEILLTLGPIVYDILRPKSSPPLDLTGRQTITETVYPSGYQSPTLGAMDLLTQTMLARNLMNLGGAGMPGGLSYVPDDFMKDFLDLIGSTFQELMSQYQGVYKVPTPKEPRAHPQTYASVNQPLQASRLRRK